MSIKDALKDLCLKVTGHESKAETIAEVIAEITINYSAPTGAKTEIPAVSSSPASDS